MSNSTTPYLDRLDLTKLSPDRRAGEISRAVRSLSPGEDLWISGRGDPHRYEHFLAKRFPSGVDWHCDAIVDGAWTARVTRS